MSYQSWPWASNQGDREFTSDQLTDFMMSRHSDGVSEGLTVKPYSGMVIKIDDGFASIKGKLFRSKTENGTPTTIDLGTAHGTYSKYISVFLRRKLSTREVIPIIKQGTPSATPAIPAIQRDADVYELRIANILIPKGITEITATMIKSTILGTECGVSVNQPVALDTAGYGAQFDAWFANLTSTLDTNQAGNLYNAVNSLPKFIVAQGSQMPPVEEGAILICIN